MNEKAQLCTYQLTLIENDLQAYITQSLKRENQKVLLEMLRYHLGWSTVDGVSTKKGKRLRPLIAMICGEVCGVEASSMLPFCTAIELLHNFSLIHDDIEDADERRHGRETLWKHWGVPQAINTGDLLFAIAAQSIGRASAYLSHERVLLAMDEYFQTCTALTTGQHLDMRFESMDFITPHAYLEMVEGKTAALLGYSTMVGAIAAGKSIKDTETFKAFGINLGIAFQIQDDYLGIWGETAKTGKAGRGDLIARKKTFPIILGLEKGNEFYHLWHQVDKISLQNTANLVQALDNDGIKELVMHEVKRYTDIAINSLNQITGAQTPAGKILFNF